MVRNLRWTGYPNHIVGGHGVRVKLMEREYTLRISKVKNTQNRLPFGSTYNEWSNTISGIINKHLPIVRESFETKSTYFMLVVHKLEG